VVHMGIAAENKTALLRGRNKRREGLKIVDGEPAKLHYQKETLKIGRPSEAAKRNVARGEKSKNERKESHI